MLEVRHYTKPHTGTKSQRYPDTCWGALLADGIARPDYPPKLVRIEIWLAYERGERLEDTYSDWVLVHTWRKSKPQSWWQKLLQRGDNNGKAKSKN